MKFKFYRFLAPILCVFLILASLPFVYAESPSETPIYVWLDCSNDDFATYSSLKVELSDIVSPNGTFKAIKIRQVDIPITETNQDSTVTIDFLVCGAIVGNVGETHNTGYTFSGGHFSSYYTSSVNCTKKYVQNFSDRGQFFDYVFPQNTTQIRQFYFSQVSYHVIASVYISGDVGQTASLICNNPPTLKFWENNTSNFVQAQWVVRGNSSVLPDFNFLFGNIMQTIQYFADHYDQISEQILAKLDFDSLDFIATQIQRNADINAEQLEIESEHQAIIDDWMDSGAGDALDNGKTQIEDADGFGLLDDFSSGISSGPQFDSNNFQYIWKSGGQSTRWFSSTCEEALHDPGLDTRGNNTTVIDFIHPQIQAVNEALGVDTDD